ncbi:DUF1127 domain-containing protein [Devosia lacusdianchii]|jgi:uncharacterized protein YjiS (DUF1127 family)|uniref:DUF1127 domain-containing protein n=1 Tax=Devosia lacusdianchii TaxID=2917991 RepID=UPI001F06D056|nr:DUF1127 domain-containing protein [Devosia sp. JXJ CY 41]
MFEPLTRKFRDWRKLRAAVRQLRHFDDRLLTDIGTRRSDIECFVASDACN